MRYLVGKPFGLMAPETVATAGEFPVITTFYPVRGDTGRTVALFLAEGMAVVYAAWLNNPPVSRDASPQAFKWDGGGERKPVPRYEDQPGNVSKDIHGRPWLWQWSPGKD